MPWGAGSPVRAIASVGAGDGELGGFDQRRLGLARREHGERVDRAPAILASAFDRVAERSGRAQQPYGMGEVVIGTRSPAIAARQKSRSRSSPRA